MLKIKVKIRTPKGQATKTEKKLRWFIIGKQKQRPRTWVSKEDDLLYWELDVTPKKYTTIMRNLALYDSMVKGIMDNKFFKKQVRGRLTPEDEENLTDMLLKQTDIRIVSTTEAQTVQEDGTTFWEKMKKKLKRIDTEETKKP